MPLLDKEVALRRVGGDAELLKEIAELFLEDYPKAMDDLRRAADAGNSKRIEKTAHGLKGCIANFGATNVVDAAKAIETMGREQRLAEIKSKLVVLGELLEQLRPELKAL